MYMSYPIGSMYGIFTYIYHKFKPNVGKYDMDGMGMSIFPYVQYVSYIFPPSEMMLGPLAFPKNCESKPKPFTALKDAAT